MSYRRVIPRDLFNEANLLKCYGALWIALDKLRDHKAAFGDGTPEGDYDGAPFRVEMDEGTGAIHVASADFQIAGERYILSRPLNSRDPWPLYCGSTDDDECAVFNDDGTLSAEFLELIR